MYSSYLFKIVRLHAAGSFHSPHLHLYISVAESVSNDSEDSDLAVTVVTSQLPPALTLSNECSREQS